MNDRLALTPPMGWNSWNPFGHAVDETAIRQTADALVETGLAACGYEYVVVDDSWEAAERVNGRLTWRTDTFPSGIPALADYVHSKGLKFGIYSCAGTHTCGGNPGSFRYEAIDARTFAEWGVDFLKYDFCFHPPEASSKASYRRMGQALRSCDRPILYSLCNWGWDDLSQWARDVGGHMWRTTLDIQDKWASIYDIGFRKQPALAPFAGPGGWNDPDMLVVGMRGKGNEHVIEGNENKGCTDDEYTTHFALWCMQAAPLMLGCDVRQLDAFSLRLLSNRHLIAINQDPLGVQATKIGAHRSIEVWRKPLANGDIAVGFFNLGPEANGKTPVSWESLGLDDLTGCTAFNCLTSEETGPFTRCFNAGEIPSHACEIYRLRPKT